MENGETEHQEEEFRSSKEKMSKGVVKNGVVCR